MSLKQKQFANVHTTLKHLLYACAMLMEYRINLRNECNKIYVHKLTIEWRVDSLVPSLPVSQLSSLAGAGNEARWLRVRDSYIS